MKDNIKWNTAPPSTVDEYIDNLQKEIERLTKEVNDVAAERDKILKTYLENSIKTEEYTLQEWSSREMLEELLERERSNDDD